MEKTSYSNTEVKEIISLLTKAYKNSSTDPIKYQPLTVLFIKSKNNQDLINSSRKIKLSSKYYLYSIIYAIPYENLPIAIQSNNTTINEIIHWRLNKGH